MAVSITARERVYQGFATMDRLTVVHGTRTGDTIEVVREIHDHGCGIAVLPFDSARRMVLVVRQLRIPVFLDDGDGHLVEACAGLIDGDDGDPAETARREALEELGTRIHALEKVGTVYTSPGMVTERMTMFLAEYGRGDRIAEGGGLLHEGEDIEILEWPVDRLWKAVENGGIADAKLLLLAQALKLRRPEL